MREKSEMKKTNPIQNVEVDVLDISVAKNRSLEPFIKTLVAPPENITQEPLGMLVGLFSVSDRKDSSAYVVNYLASVAKKEYFLNPRRGAIESFESMLHHTNLALAELVKNGQVSWVGSLHGAIAIIEKGNIHFSLTGDAKIFLFRNDRFIDISEGLASKDAAAHPLKTFVEISSGRLSGNDCILLASPEVFEVFTFSELDRNARRLVPEGKFARFLETALGNELALGGALLLTAKENLAAAHTGREKRTRKEKPIVPPNAFSATAFDERKRAEGETRFVPEISVPDEKLGNARTGDIYVQGKAPEGKESHPAVTSFEWMLEDMRKAIRRTAVSARKSIVRDLSEASSSVVTGIGNGFTVMKRSAKRATLSMLERMQKKVQAEKARLTARTALPKNTSEQRNLLPRAIESPKSVSSAQRIAVAYSTTVEKTKIIFRDIPRQVLPIPKTTAEPTGGMPAHTDLISTKQKPRFAMPQVRMPAIPRSLPLPITTSARKAGDALRAIPWQIISLAIGRLLSTVGRFLRSCHISLVRMTLVLKKKFISLPPKRQLLSAAGIAFLLTMTWIAIRHTEESAPEATQVITPVETPIAFPVPAGEKNASRATPTKLLSFPTDRTVVRPVYLKGRLFVITDTDITDAENGSVHQIPSSPIVAATAMDDLNALFLVSDDSHIYTFYPTTGKFATNTIAFPNGPAPRHIGTFLTYLYVFDRDNRQIIRYPRADGGFGTGKDWLANAPTLQDITGFTVSENIYIHSSSDVTAYSKGKPIEAFSLEKPLTPLTITNICANPDAPEIFAVLDAKALRIIIYSSQGQIVKQLYSEQLTQATSCSLSTDGTTTAVSSDSTTLVFEIFENQ
jgi:hypothetical protein